MIRECPFCGIEVTPQARRHLTVCPRNPALREAIIAALRDPTRPGYAVGPRTYGNHSYRRRVPCVTLLYRAWGDWEVVAAYFGLWYEKRRRKGKGKSHGRASEV